MTHRKSSIYKEHLNAARNAIPSRLASFATFAVQETELMRPQSHLGLYISLVSKNEGRSTVAEASHAKETAGNWPKLVGVVPFTSSQDRRYAAGFPGGHQMGSKALQMPQNLIWKRFSSSSLSCPCSRSSALPQ